MDFEDIVKDEERREGGSKLTNDPADKGGRTQYGISEKSFPQAWADGHVTEEEGDTIYMDKFIKGPGFDKIPDSHTAVCHQLVDWSVTSGPYIPVMELQRELGLTIDGKFGPITLNALTKQDPKVINNVLVKRRCFMLARICQKTPSQIRFLGGWLERALSFFVN